jgi:hypothetical protein
MTPLRSGSFEHVVSVLRALGPPRWPVWVPLWTFASAADELAAEREIAAILRTSGPNCYLIIADDLSQHLLEGRELTPREATKVPPMPKGDPLPDDAELLRWRKFVRELPGGPSAV